MKYSLILYFLWISWSILGGTVPENAGMRFLGIVYSRFCLYPVTGAENIQMLDMDEVCNAPLWFLTAYAAALCVFYFTQYLVNEKGLSIKLVFLFLSGITIALSYLPILLPWSVDTCFLCAMFMWTGNLAAPVIKKIIVSRKNIRWISLLSMLFLAAAFFNGSCNLSTRSYGVHGILSIVLFAFTGIIGSCLFILMCKLIDHFKFTGVFRIMGKHTLFLLGFHLFLYKAIDRLIEIAGINDGKWYMEHFTDVIIVAVTSIVLVLMAFYWEKYTAERKIKKGAN